MTDPQTDCMLARASISARLDDELPELERVRLDAHLRECPACSVWAEQAEDLTRGLREAALETPSAGFAVRRYRRRRATTFGLATASAVAAASAAAILGLQPAALNSPHESGLPAPASSPSALVTSHVTPGERLLRLPDGLHTVAVQSTDHVHFRPT